MTSACNSVTMCVGVVVVVVVVVVVDQFVVVKTAVQSRGTVNVSSNSWLRELIIFQVDY